MNQHQLIQSIVLQGGFQLREVYEISLITDYLGSLINQDFPQNLLNPENQTSNIEQFVKLIQDLYENINLQILQSKQTIQKYHEEYQQILKQLAEARAYEKLNEYEIDLDSKVYVDVLGAKGLPFQSYFVKIACFGQEIQTETSVQTCSPNWNIQFQFDVPSPHGQIFVYLIQTNQEKKNIKIGQLVLPLFSFKDQQHSQNEYILEDESGVLGNVNQKLTLIIWWVHSRVALIQDHLIQVDQFRKEIEEQNSLIQQNTFYLTILNNIFNKKNLKQLPKQQEQNTQPQQQLQPQAGTNQQDWRITFQKIMYSIAKFFKSTHLDSIEEWQITVLALSIVLSLFTILFIMIARPCIQQLVIVMSIGMLVWVYEVDQIKITRILGQISLILLIQCIFDSVWLFLDYKVWWTDTTHLVMEQQIMGNSILNYLSYFATIFYIPLDLILCACSYDLSLKYQQNIPI